MKFLKAFLDQHELEMLTQSLIDNHDPAYNVIDLDNIESIKSKIIAAIKQEFGVETEFLMSYIFLACETTMEAITARGGWHTDGTSCIVDGDCFNAWIPVYIDSTDTGLEIITQNQNRDFYQQIGDRTNPLQMLTKEVAPDIFKLIGAPDDSNQVAINHFNGALVPFNINDLQVSRIDHPQAGDLGLFKQADIHRGFHTNGVRIQLSLKFISKQATLNKKGSNWQYAMFERITGGGDIHQFQDTQKILEKRTHKKPVSKHGRLEALLIKFLLDQHLSASKVCND